MPLYVSSTPFQKWKYWGAVLATGTLMSAIRTPMHPVCISAGAKRVPVGATVSPAVRDSNYWNTSLGEKIPPSSVKVL